MFVCCVGVYIVHILNKLRFWHNFIVSPYRFSLDHNNPSSSSLLLNCNDPLSLFRPLFIYILIYNMPQLTLGSHAAGCVCVVGLPLILRWAHSPLHHWGLGTFQLFNTAKGERRHLRVKIHFRMICRRFNHF